MTQCQCTVLTQRRRMRRDHLTSVTLLPFPSKVMQDLTQEESLAYHQLELSRGAGHFVPFRLGMSRAMRRFEGNTHHLQYPTPSHGLSTPTPRTHQALVSPFSLPPLRCGAVWAND
jgi:hypothetical protein